MPSQNPSTFSSTSQLFKDYSKIRPTFAFITFIICSFSSLIALFAIKDTESPLSDTITVSLAILAYFALQPVNWGSLNKCMGSGELPELVDVKGIENLCAGSEEKCKKETKNENKSLNKDKLNSVTLGRVHPDKTDFKKDQEQPFLPITKSPYVRSDYNYTSYLASFFRGIVRFLGLSLGGLFVSSVNCHNAHKYFPQLGSNLQVLQFLIYAAAFYVPAFVMLEFSKKFRSLLPLLFGLPPKRNPLARRLEDVVASLMAIKGSEELLKELAREIKNTPLSLLTLTAIARKIAPIDTATVTVRSKLRYSLNWMVLFFVGYNLYPAIFQSIDLAEAVAKFFNITAIPKSVYFIYGILGYIGNLFPSLCGTLQLFDSMCSWLSLLSSGKAGNLLPKLSIKSLKSCFVKFVLLILKLLPSTALAFANFITTRLSKSMANMIASVMSSMITLVSYYVNGGTAAMNTLNQLSNEHYRLVSTLISVIEELIKCIEDNTFSDDAQIVLDACLKRLFQPQEENGVHEDYLQLLDNGSSNQDKVKTIINQLVGGEPEEPESKSPSSSDSIYSIVSSDPSENGNDNNNDRSNLRRAQTMLYRLFRNNELVSSSTLGLVPCASL